MTKRGQPPKDGRKRTSSIGPIRCQPEDRAALNQEAERLGISANDLVIMILRENLPEAYQPEHQQ